MKKYLLFALLLLGLPLSVAAQDFLPGLEDVPLMPELTVEEGVGMVFDSPAGRIVEVYAQGTEPLTRPRIEAFYQKTLPALGWKKQKNRNHFLRERESLMMDFFGPAENPLVRFTLAPQPESP